MVSHVSEQKSCHDWLLNEVPKINMMQLSFFTKRMPQGTRLTELEQGKFIAHKDAGMSIHEISKKKLAG